MCNQKIFKGGTLSRGGGQFLARTSFIVINPIHIRESSASRGGEGDGTALAPFVTLLVCYNGGYKKFSIAKWHTKLVIYNFAGS